MKLVRELLPGALLVEPFRHRDARGEFVKTFHEDLLRKLGIEFTLREEFFSVSDRDVLRGMHFQLPPHAHQKIVYCITGGVLDVIVDLRKSSPTCGRAVATDLTAVNRHVLFLPVGFAHGFLSLADRSCLVYKTDSVHAPESDSGIRWDSFQFDWPQAAADFTISDRDLTHLPLSEFDSPF